MKRKLEDGVEERLQRCQQVEMEEKKKGLSGEGGRGQTVRTGTSILSSSTGYGCTFVPSFAEKGKATVLLIRGGTGFCEG